jgi:hypothetical protein
LIIEIKIKNDLVKLQYVFKGCIEVAFKNTVDAKKFSMDDRLLQEDKHEPDYPDAFVWAGGTQIIFPFKYEDDTEELKEKETLLGVKFQKIKFCTTAYEITLVFHDLEVNPYKLDLVKKKSFISQMIEKKDTMSSFL